MSTIKSSTEHLTLNADGAGKEIKFQANGVEKASISSAGAFTSTSIDATKLSGALPAIDGSALTGDVGKVVQVVNYQTNAASTGTTIIPRDDTIPQNTEGAEFMTLAITPTSSTNILIIEVLAQLSPSVIGTQLSAALFQDATAGALVTGSQYTPGAGQSKAVPIGYRMVAGTTSATTFKVRCGQSSAGTITFNGSGGSRLMGGTYYSFIRITEIEA